MSHPPQHAAIIGGDITAIFAAGGWQVHVVSPTPATRDSLPACLGKALAALQAAPALATQVQAVAHLESVPWPQVEIVIEAATADLALKQELFSQRENRARADIHPARKDRYEKMLRASFALLTRKDE